MTHAPIPTARRVLVARRSRGLCERCGVIGTQVHHRMARGMGGGDGRQHDIRNLVRLCDGCHDRATRYPLKLAPGGWVLRHGQSLDTPVLLVARFSARLTPAGTYSIDGRTFGNLGEVFDWRASMWAEGIEPPDAPGWR